MNARSLTKKLYYLEKKSNIISSVCMISIMTACGSKLGSAASVSNTSHPMANIPPTTCPLAVQEKPVLLSNE